MRQGGKLVDVARERAEVLRKLAAQAESIRWKPEAVMRENASLILSLVDQIERLERKLARSNEQKAFLLERVDRAS
jgi:hypothetical protein